MDRNEPKYDTYYERCMEIYNELKSLADDKNMYVGKITKTEVFKKYSAKQFYDYLGLLIRTGSVTQIRRGNRHQDSVWAIGPEPTEENLHAFVYKVNEKSQPMVSRIETVEQQCSQALKLLADYAQKLKQLSEAMKQLEKDVRDIRSNDNGVSGKPTVTRKTTRKGPNA